MRNLLQLIFFGYLVTSGVHTLMADDLIKGQKLDGLRAPRNGNVYVVAHRGAHDGVPENTLAAYQRAIDMGCDFVEIDVRTTRDGVLVSIHNSTIEA
jgi:glycerophosphoryl diester phosphodiesterase